MKSTPALSSAILFLSLILVSAGLKAQKATYSQEVEARIALVEKSLGEAIRTDDLPLLLEERMKFYKVPGVSVAVIRNHKVEWARGYGFADQEGKIPVTSETLFQAASISKSLNALGVVKLFEERKLDLDADINQYLKTWKFPYDSAGKKVITVRNLLSHTAGTSVHGFRGYAAGEPVPTLVQILDGQKPANSAPIRSLFDAGTKVQYSGGGTTISQMITMDVSGKSYDVYMKQHVLDPLGMHLSFYTIPPGADKGKFLATGYRGDGTVVTGKYHVYPEQAAASLWTNPTELSNFIIQLQLAGKGKSSAISQKSAKLMLDPVMGEAGLGVFMSSKGGESYFGHGGANEGFRCQYFGSVDSGNGVVVMVNSDNGAIVYEIINSVASVYGWKDFYQPVIKKVVPLSDELLDSYAGEYEIAPTFKITIWRSGHALKGMATNQPEVDLFAESENRFFLKVVDAQIEFHKDSTGKVAKLVLFQNGRQMEGTRVE